MAWSLNSKLTLECKKTFHISLSTSSRTRRPLRCCCCFLQHRAMMITHPSTHCLAGMRLLLLSLTLSLSLCERLEAFEMLDSAELEFVRVDVTRILWISLMDSIKSQPPRFWSDHRDVSTSRRSKRKRADCQHRSISKKVLDIRFTSSCCRIAWDILCLWLQKCVRDVVVAHPTPTKHELTIVSRTLVDDT